MPTVSVESLVAMPMLVCSETWSSDGDNNQSTKVGVIKEMCRSKNGIQAASNVLLE